MRDTWDPAQIDRVSPTDARRGPATRGARRGAAVPARWNLLPFFRCFIGSAPSDVGRRPHFPEPPSPPEPCRIESRQRGHSEGGPPLPITLEGAPPGVVPGATGPRSQPGEKPRHPPTVVVKLLAETLTQVALLRAYRQRVRQREHRQQDHRHHQTPRHRSPAQRDQEAPQIQRVPYMRVWARSRQLRRLHDAPAAQKRMACPATTAITPTR